MSGATQLSNPPDGGWGWIVVAGVACNNGLVVGFDFSFPLIFKKLLEIFDTTAEEVAWIVAIYRGLRCFASPLSSALCNHFGHRKVSIVGGLMNAIGLIMFAFPVSVPYLTLSRGVICGLACSMVQVASISMNGLYFSTKRARALSIGAIGVSLGNLLIPQLIFNVFYQYGYTGGILLSAAILLHICPCSALFRPLNISDTQNDSPESKSADPTMKNPSKASSTETEQLTQTTSSNKNFVEETSNDMADYTTAHARCCRCFTRILNGCLIPIYTHLGFNILKDIRVLVFGMVLIAFSFGFTILNAFLAGYAAEFAIDTWSVSLAMSIAGGFSIIFRFLGGFIYDLGIVRNHMSLVASCHVASVGIFIFLFTKFAGNIYAFYIIWLFLFCLASTFMGIYPAVVLSIVGRKKFTSGFGICRALEGVGYFVGPIAGGALRDHKGTFAAANYLAGGIVCGIAALAVIIIICRRNKDM